MVWDSETTIQHTGWLRYWNETDSLQRSNFFRLPDVLMDSGNRFGHTGWLRYWGWTDSLKDVEASSDSSVAHWLGFDTDTEADLLSEIDASSTLMRSPWNRPRLLSVTRLSFEVHVVAVLASSCQLIAVNRYCTPQEYFQLLRSQQSRLDLLSFPETSAWL